MYTYIVGWNKGIARIEWEHRPKIRRAFETSDRGRGWVRARRRRSRIRIHLCLTYLVDISMESMHFAGGTATATHTETALEGVFQSCFWWDSDLVYKISFFVLFLNKLSNMIEHIKIRLHGEVFWIWRFFSINYFSLFLSHFFPSFW